MEEAKMIKKKPVTVVINELDLPIKTDWVTVDANDRSPDAAAAIKAMLKTPAQILKTALNSAVPEIKVGRNFKKLQKKKAKKSRRQNPILLAIKKKMLNFKKDGALLKQFLDSAENGSIESIRAKQIPNLAKVDNPTYVFSVEVASEEKKRTASFKTVEKWWADCY